MTWVFGLSPKWRHLFFRADLSACKMPGPARDIVSAGQSVPIPFRTWRCVHGLVLLGADIFVERRLLSDAGSVGLLFQTFLFDQHLVLIVACREILNPLLSCPPSQREIFWTLGFWSRAKMAPSFIPEQTSSLASCQAMHETSSPVEKE